MNGFQLLSTLGQLEELEQSGQVPRLDSWLASELSSPKTLKQCPDLEQDVQAYIELCTRSCVAPKGRRILAIVSRYFDLDCMRGSVIAASTLLQIEYIAIQSRIFVTSLSGFAWFLGPFPLLRGLARG